MYEVNRRFGAAPAWEFRHEHHRLPSRPWRKLDAHSASARQSRAVSWVKILTAATTCTSRPGWIGPSMLAARHAYAQEEFARYLRDMPPAWRHLVGEPMFRLEGRNQRLLHRAHHDHGKRLPEFLRWFEERGIPPHPQLTGAHVHSDLDVDAADLQLSGRSPEPVERLWREAWTFVQIGRGWVRRIRFG